MSKRTLDYTEARAVSVEALSSHTVLPRACRYPRAGETGKSRTVIILTQAAVNWKNPGNAWASSLSYPIRREQPCHPSLTTPPSPLLSLEAQVPDLARRLPGSPADPAADPGSRTDPCPLSSCRCCWCGWSSSGGGSGGKKSASAASSSSKKSAGKRKERKRKHSQDREAMSAAKRQRRQHRQSLASRQRHRYKSSH